MPESTGRNEDDCSISSVGDVDDGNRSCTDISKACEDIEVIDEIIEIDSVQNQEEAPCNISCLEKQCGSRTEELPTTNSIMDNALDAILENIYGNNCENDICAAVEEANVGRHRHIVDVDYIFHEIQKRFDGHNPWLECQWTDIVKLQKEQRFGLKTKLFFRCNNCRFECGIMTEGSRDDCMGLNESAVLGAYSAGVGASQINEFLAALDVHNMSEDTWTKYSPVIEEAIRDAAVAEMLQAAERSRQIAIRKGNFIVHNGVKIGIIYTTGDGVWCKRVYHSGKYNALSGAAVIIDEETKEVIDLGVKNKMCAACEWAERNERPPKPHTCFKNFDREAASTAMEKETIVEIYRCFGD